MSENIKNDMNRGKGKEIIFLDYLLPILKRKRMVFGLTLSVVLITACISFLLPPIYRAETKILPPQMKHFDMFSRMSALYEQDTNFLTISISECFRAEQCMTEL
jgi:capsular polysaccharide biosynthesis protein